MYPAVPRGIRVRASTPFKLAYMVSVESSALSRPGILPVNRWPMSGVSTCSALMFQPSLAEFSPTRFVPAFSSALLGALLLEMDVTNRMMVVSGLMYLVDAVIGVAAIGQSLSLLMRLRRFGSSGSSTAGPEGASAGTDSGAGSSARTQPAARW